MEPLTAGGYVPSHADKCFVRKNNTSCELWAAITVEDFLVVGTTPQFVDAFKTHLGKKYNVKRLRKSTRYLGWRITADADGTILLCQPELAHAVVRVAGMNQ